MLQDSAATRDKLQDLRDAGIGVSIDDFGTGYSSLSYLQRFPVTTLKIARDFVDVDGIDAEAWELVNAIVALGRALRLSVIAEGVEQWSQLGRLRTLGCEFAQGFYFARPLDPASIETVLAHGSILIGDQMTETGRSMAGRRGSSRRAERRRSAARIRFRCAPNRTFVPLAHVGLAGAWSGRRAAARSAVAVRSENSANPSKGGDAKPGIFREPVSRRPPGCQAPHIDRTRRWHRWRRWIVRTVARPADTDSSRTVAGASTSRHPAHRRDRWSAVLYDRGGHRAGGHAGRRLRPRGDVNSMVNTTAYTGARPGGPPGYTGKGVDVARHRHRGQPGRRPGRRRQGRLRPGPLVRIAGART